MVDTPGPPVGVSSRNLTATGQSKYYVVIITSTRWGTVQAWMPDTVQMAVKSYWGPIVGNYESALLNWTAVSATGAAAFSRRLTAQEWRGMEPFQLILRLHFFATEDANSEVIEPIKRLLKMSLPTKINPDQDFSWLRPPGPVPELPKSIYIPGVGEKPLPGGGGAGRPNQDYINVYLGNFLALKEVFIADIPAVQFSAKLSKDGLPMEGTCDIIFKTVYAPTAQEMDTYFGAIKGTPTTGGRPILG